MSCRKYNLAGPCLSIGTENCDHGGWRTEDPGFTTWKAHKILGKHSKANLRQNQKVGTQWLRALQAGSQILTTPKVESEL